MERDERRLGELQALIAYTEDEHAQEPHRGPSSTLGHVQTQEGQNKDRDREFQANDSGDTARLNRLVFNKEEIDADPLVKQEQERLPKELTKLQSVGLW